jgi:hypothetical protein
LDELNLDLMGFLLVLSYVYLGEKKEKVFRPSLLSNPLNGVFYYIKFEILNAR